MLKCKVCFTEATTSILRVVYRRNFASDNKRVIINVVQVMCEIASSCLLAMTVTGTALATLHAQSLRVGTTKQSVEQVRSIKGKLAFTAI